MGLLFTREEMASSSVRGKTKPPLDQQRLPGWKGARDCARRAACAAVFRAIGITRKIAIFRARFRVPAKGEIRRNLAGYRAISI